MLSLAAAPELPRRRKVPPVELTGRVDERRVTAAEPLSSVMLVPPPSVRPLRDARLPLPLRVSEVLALSNVNAPL